MTDALAELQSEAESRMTDVCRATRTTTGGGSLDPVTGVPAADARAVVYQGKCRLRTGGSISAGSQRTSAGDVVVQVASILSLPIGAPRFLVNDRVEFMSSVNPNLPALVFTVSGLVPGSQMTAQRVEVTAVID